MNRSRSALPHENFSPFVNGVKSEISTSSSRSGSGGSTPLSDKTIPPSKDEPSRLPPGGLPQVELLGPAVELLQFRGQLERLQPAEELPGVFALQDRCRFGVGHRCPGLTRAAPVHKGGRLRVVSRPCSRGSCGWTPAACPP